MIKQAFIERRNKTVDEGTMGFMIILLIRNLLLSFLEEYLDMLMRLVVK